MLDPRIHVTEPATRITRRLGSRLRLANAAGRHFLEHPVDICFVPGNFHWPVVPALAQLPAPVRPLVVAQVSAALDKPQRGRLRQALFEVRMRRLLQGADGVVCMSHRARDQANRILGRNIATRIPLPALENEAGPSSVAKRCRTLLAAGRLVPEKGFDMLIEAFARMDDATARLIIVGSGPEEVRLRRQVQQLGLVGRVQLPGAVANIRPWLDQARALVLSSRFEGFGAVLLEALAAGRQVITTQCTHAIEELGIGGNLGSVVPVADVPALTRAMEIALRESPPEPARLAAVVADYRIESGAREYLRAFERWNANGAATESDSLPASVAI
jgi:glycosyltransferase involved in cell wall biosynthesis